MWARDGVAAPVQSVATLLLNDVEIATGTKEDDQQVGSTKLERTCSMDTPSLITPTGSMFRTRNRATADTISATAITKEMPTETPASDGHATHLTAAKEHKGGLWSGGTLTKPDVHNN